MPSRLKCNTKVWDAVKRKLQKFDQRSVDVGFFRTSRYGPENDNLYVAEVAMRNDYGTDSVPSRPFMTDDFDSYVRKNLAKDARGIYFSLLWESKLTFKPYLRALGENYSVTLQSIIQDYPGSNSAWWIEQKGFDDPLYHTGMMVSSVSYRLPRGRK